MSPEPALGAPMFGVDAAARRVSVPHHPVWLILVASLWMASVGNLALWREMQELGLFARAGGMLFLSLIHI